MAHEDSLNPDDVLSALIVRLKGTAYALTIFSPAEIDGLNLFMKRGSPFIKCAVTGRERAAKPEEIVRQLYVRKLISEYGYPKERIALEKAVQFGSSVHEKAADIVVFDKDDPETAFIIVEVKKTKRSDGIEQLKSYCNAEGSPIGVWTNGGQVVALHREEPNYFRALSDIPSVTQTLSDVLNERWTLEDLSKENKLVKERMTLKSVILDMENLVLANAGVDASEFLFCYLRSPAGQKQIVREVTGATGQQHLLKDKVARIVVPVPPADLCVSLRDILTKAWEQEKLAASYLPSTQAILLSAFPEAAL